MAIFRDDMLQVTSTPTCEYYIPENGYEPEEYDGAYIDVIKFRAPGHVIAARLDAMGIDTAAVLAQLEDQLNGGRDSIYLNTEFRANLDADVLALIDREADFRRSLCALGAQGWVNLLADAPADSVDPADRSVGSRKWLLEDIAEWDERYAARLILLAFPDAEIVLDLTGLVQGGWLDEPDLASLASSSATAITGAAGMHASVVVLTEGRTDAEFLTAGLRILYPYLTDLIRFLDYERKPEGGVAALIRMVRAFAAAGIVNRVVAVLDNDTAAADGLRTIDPAKLPAQIQIFRYPQLDLARNYPTLGPPTLDSPAGSVALADVNGLAGSIELYLGRDVLTRPDGTLRPVQWKAFIPGMARYQGEVVDKEAIHQAFRSKCALATESPECIKDQDWEGIRLIVDAIRASAQSFFGGRVFLQ